MGRPSKRTPENRERILSILRAATTTRKSAYTAIGMSRDAFNDWIKADGAFALAVEQAEQEAITRNVLLVQKAAQPRTVRKTRTEYGPAERDAEGKALPGGPRIVVAQTVEEYEEEGDWRAAKWLLETKDPESYGPKQTIKLVPPEKLTDEDLLAELVAVAARLGLAGGGPEAGPDALPDG